MKKDYLIPLAILIGSIIIAAAVYLGTTSKERTKFNFCIKQNSASMPDAPKKDIKVLCENIRYLEN